MAITGISAISGEQIIAAGAVSAKEAGKASFTTGGNDIQNLYDTVSINSASWENVVTSTATGVSYVTGISAINGTPLLATGVFNKGKMLVGSSDPGMYLTGTHGTAYYKANELIINRTGYGEQIKFNLGSAGSQVIGSAAGTRGAFIDMSNASHEAFLGVRNDEDAKLELDGEVITPTKITGYDSVYSTVNDNSASWGGGASYTGDAQGALDEVYTNSGTWNDTTNTVNTNSGAWGGDALPISAGPGVKVKLTDGKLLFSTDETVLWSGETTPITGITLNESYANFDRVRFYWNPWTDTMSWQVTDIPGTVSYINLSCGWANNSQRALFVYEFSSPDKLTFSQVNGAFTNITSTAWTTATACKVYKIVGINRTAGSN
jgi:hypothetical protein